MRDYYTANADIIKVRSRIWRADNPEQRNELGRAHRARRRGAPINDLTVAQWLEIKDAFGACCAYCGDMCDALTQDHIVPLSQGGSHTASNIAPACHSCNCKKHTSSAEEFLARLDAEGNSALHKLG
jgi:5-methylcytosine-specific restriction endonuclease McrA